MQAETDYMIHLNGISLLVETEDTKTGTMKADDNVPTRMQNYVTQMAEKAGE